LPYGLLSHRESNGLTTFRVNTILRDLGFILTPGGLHLRQRKA